MPSEIQINPDALVESLREDPELFTTFSEQGFNEAGLLLEIRATAADNWSPTKDYWYELRREIRILLCSDDSKYKDLRPNLVDILNNATGRKCVVTIAGALAATVGVCVATLVAFVALVLYAVGKVGLNAWCSATESDFHKKLDAVPLDDEHSTNNG